MALGLTACQLPSTIGRQDAAEEPERYLVDESVAAPEWTDSYTAEPKQKGDLRIMQISDPHYYSPRLTDQCTLYQNAMVSAAGRDALHIGEILDAFFEQMQQYDPDVLIVSGDLSMNGEKASHEDFAAYLRQFEENGIQVLVIPGNHDINSQSRGRSAGTGQSRPRMSPRKNLNRSMLILGTMRRYTVTRTL